MTLTTIIQIIVYSCILKPLQQVKPRMEGVSISTPLANQSTILTSEQVTTTNMSTFVDEDQIIFSEWPTWLEPALLMSLLIVLLHLLDRQIELTSRSDFLWMTKLSSEEEGGDTMLGINKVSS